MAVVVGLEDMVLGLQRKQKDKRGYPRWVSEKRVTACPVRFKKQSLVRPAENEEARI